MTPMQPANPTAASQRCAHASQRLAATWHLAQALEAPAQDEGYDCEANQVTAPQRSTCCQSFSSRNHLIAAE
jgi:hypothetical protein